MQIKKVFFSKIFIAILFLIIGLGLSKTYDYFKNYKNSSQSFKSNIKAWVNDAKEDIDLGTKKIFYFNGKKFVTEIKETVNLTIDKTQNNLENTSNKLTNPLKDSKNSNKNNIKDSIDNEPIKSTEVRKYEDNNSFSFELILTGFRHEDVIISINHQAINFSSNLNNKSLEINGKNYRNNNLNSFYHSFELSKFDHQKDPEITYHDNIVCVKFYKISTNK
jgi:hypothetical protein